MMILSPRAPTLRARASSAIASMASSVKRSWTFDFARELRALGITERLWAQPPGLGGFGRRQLPAALAYAEPSAAG